MVTQEQDSAVYRWGLQLFEGDPFSNNGYYGSLTHNNAENNYDQYSKESQYALGASNAENDEFSALDEGFLQLSVMALDSPHEAVENLQPTTYVHNWPGQSLEHCNYVHHNGHQEQDDRGPSSSCSSPVDQLNLGEEWLYSLELMDAYDLDGEVGKRLNQMVPIPHVPKINGEIPSVDEATLDHQRLLDRLHLYELVENKILGDGNCQFRALSDQFYRTPEHHKFVRKQVVNQLKSCREIYEGYVPMAYWDYLKKISKSGEWGDHVTLQAAADSYGVKIFVITSFKDTCYIEILPNIERSNRVIILSFWAEVHYNSIYPHGDLPSLGSKKKKRWSGFQDHHAQLSEQYN